jgi:hypothetical protein
MYFFLIIFLFDYWIILFWVLFIKTSFNIDLLEVESCIILKNNICDNIFNHHNVLSPKSQH